MLFRSQADLEKKLAEIDREMSTYRDDSEISRFNRAPSSEWFAVSRDVAKVVTASREISEKSYGAQDITVGPLVNLWRFGPKDSASSGKKVEFARLLQAISTVHEVKSEGLLQAGRQRQWVAARAQLVFLARQWCRMATKELGRRLHRDASMISRLNSWYEVHRDEKAERKVARVLAIVNTQA